MRPASMAARRWRAEATATAAAGTRSTASCTMLSSSAGEWRYSSTRLLRGQPCRRTSTCGPGKAGRQAGGEGHNTWEAEGEKGAAGTAAARQAQHSSCSLHTQAIVTSCHMRCPGPPRSPHLCMFRAHHDAGRGGRNHSGQPQVAAALRAVAVCSRGEPGFAWQGSAERERSRETALGKTAGCDSWL